MSGLHELQMTKTRYNFYKFLLDGRIPDKEKSLKPAMNQICVIGDWLYSTDSRQLRKLKNFFDLSEGNYSVIKFDKEQLILKLDETYQFPDVLRVDLKEIPEHGQEIQMRLSSAGKIQNIITASFITNFLPNIQGSNSKEGEYIQLTYINSDFLKYLTVLKPLDLKIWLSGGHSPVKLFIDGDIEHIIMPAYHTHFIH
jgi:hypothetical protein